MLQTVANSDDLISNAQQKQKFFLPQSSYSKQMRHFLAKEHSHSEILNQRLKLKDTTVSHPPLYAENELVFSQIVEAPPQ